METHSAMALCVSIKYGPVQRVLEQVVQPQVPSPPVVVALLTLRDQASSTGVRKRKVDREVHRRTVRERRAQRDAARNVMDLAGDIRELELGVLLDGQVEAVGTIIHVPGAEADRVVYDLRLIGVLFIVQVETG